MFLCYFSTLKYSLENNKTREPFFEIKIPILSRIIPKIYRPNVKELAMIIDSNDNVHILKSFQTNLVYIFGFLFTFILDINLYINNKFKTGIMLIPTTHKFNKNDLYWWFVSNKYDRNDRYTFNKVTYVHDYKKIVNCFTLFMFNANHIVYSYKPSLMKLQLENK